MTEEEVKNTEMVAETTETVEVEIEEELKERIVFYCFIDYLNRDDKIDLKMRSNNILIYKEKEYLIIDDLYTKRDMTKIRVVEKDDRE